MAKLAADHRRALELLVGCPDGCNEATMIAHGLTVEGLCALVGGGLATVKAVRMFAGGTPVDVPRVYVTDAGRRAIQGG